MQETHQGSHPPPMVYVMKYLTNPGAQELEKVVLDPIVLTVQGRLAIECKNH